MEIFPESTSFALFLSFVFSQRSLFSGIKTFDWIIFKEKDFFSLFSLKSTQPLPHHLTLSFQRFCVITVAWVDFLHTIWLSFTQAVLYHSIKRKKLFSFDLNFIVGSHSFFVVVLYDFPLLHHTSPTSVFLCVVLSLFGEDFVLFY